MTYSWTEKRNQTFVKLGDTWFDVSRIHAIRPHHVSVKKANVFLGPGENDAFDVDLTADECIEALGKASP